jgi:hypothetical protein
MARRVRVHGKESSDFITGIRREYPELGSCLYFDLADKTHAVLYELPGNRLNWLWYINGPEPELTVMANRRSIPWPMPLPSCK